MTHVIHNAWKVDFNQSLKSFEPLVAGTRKLVDTCYEFDHPVTILYSSSISVALGWSAKQGMIPETPIPDPALAAGMGYGSSKYIVEHVSYSCAICLLWLATYHASIDPRQGRNR